MKNPEKIELDKNQADALIARLDANSLTDFDRTILKFVLQWYLWLQSALLESKISISRIKSMFGFKKTKSSKNLEAEVGVTGWLGGYNFQWAWSSGFAAGSPLLSCNKTFIITSIE